jgi:hypothetical protein
VKLCDDYRLVCLWTRLLRCDEVEILEEYILLKSLFKPKKWRGSLKNRSTLSPRVTGKNRPTIQAVVTRAGRFTRSNDDGKKARIGSHG